MPLLPCHETSA